MERITLFKQGLCKTKLFFFFLILLSFQSAFGQKNIKIPLDKGNEWFPFYEDENVILASIIMECNDPAGGPSSNYVFISFENKKEENILVEWHYDIYGKKECFTCHDPDDEYNFRFSLKPGETVIPDCSLKKTLIDEGAKTVFFATYLGRADLQSEPDIVKVILSDLITYIPN